MLATFKAFTHKSQRAEYDWIIAQYTTTRFGVLLCKKNEQQQCSFPVTHVVDECLVREQKYGLICYKDILRENASFQELSAVLSECAFLTLVLLTAPAS